MNKKQFSLKRVLGKTIVFCWVVPIILIILSFSYYSNVKIKESFLDEISITASSAMTVAQQKLAYVVQESKKASYDDTIETAYQNYLTTDDTVALYRATTSYLDNSYEYNEYIGEYVLLYHDLENELYLGTHYAATTRLTDVRAWAESNKDSLLQISSDIGTEIYFATIDGELCLVRNLVDSSYTPYAVLVFCLNPQDLFDNIALMPFAVESQWVIDGQTVAISQTVSDLPDFDYERSDNIYALSNNYYVYQQSFTLGGLDSSYQVLIDTEVLYQDYEVLIRILVIMFALLVPLILLMTYLLRKHFSMPIGLLVHASNKIEQGQIGYQIDSMPQSEEFSCLVQRFNNMSTSMQEQVDVIYKEQEALQIAKIKALQSQINPHFLNNTLEVINWEVRLGENQKAASMIESLSTMLNAAIARNDKQLKRLQEEMLYVDAYLLIVSTRMGSRLTIEKQIDPAVCDCQVPLLILQPIVENAIEHGITHRMQGTLIIRAYRTDDQLIIEVENDNALSDADKQRIEKLLNWDGTETMEQIGHASIGIRNVNQRIKLIFGKTYGLTMTESAQGGTMAKIILPIR